MNQLVDLSFVKQRIREKLKTLKTPSKGQGGKKGAACHNEETLLLSALLHRPEKAPEALKRITLEDINDGVVKSLLKRLIDGRVTGDSISRIAETDEERALVSRLSLLPGFDTLKVEENIEGCIKKLTIRTIDGKIKDAEAAGDLKIISLLIKERNTIMREVE